VFARALAEAGWEVAATGRLRGDVEETARETGGTAHVLDVTDASGVRAVFGEIGPVDLLVNNAGILGPIGPFAECDFEEWWQATDVNLRGAMLCTHAVLPDMIRRRSGRVINLVTGAFSAAHLSAYLTSKTALVRATECLAHETWRDGVALFCVAPGTIRTDMSTYSSGSRWIPWFRQIFEQGRDLPPERAAAMVVALGSGKYDALTGLFLTPFDDLDALLADRAAIDRERWHTLQLRPRVITEEAAAIGAIRAAAGKIER
jgi:NAD(P)-dependent dehydrogenase (short-subunit alcohol dehydrogenase family)